MVIDGMPTPEPSLSIAPCFGAIARARDVDVVMTGLGGDEVLDGSPHLFGEILRRGQIARALHGALKTRGVFYQGPVGRFGRFILWPLLEPTLPASARRYVLRRHRPGPSWAGPALGAHVDLHAPPITARATLSESPVERYTRILESLSLASRPLIQHMEEVAGGYSLRAPFLDDDLLRVVATLPPLSLMQGGFLRGLMREAMRGLVPEEVRLRETKGSWHWFVDQALRDGEGLEILADLADVRMLADLRLVDAKRFREVFDGFGSRDDANYCELWRVLAAEAFLRHHARESIAEAA
jgi:asparagine synthase (glutamine-hydrolysing)